MKTHQLKTWPGPFQAVLDGTKRHEIRVNDRGFAVGDVLLLQEWSLGVQHGRRWGDWPNGTRAHCIYGGHWERVEGGWKASGGDAFPTPGASVGRIDTYTGRSLRVRVTYLSPGGQWGLPQGLCVMSIEKTTEGE